MHSNMAEKEMIQLRGHKTVLCPEIKCDAASEVAGIEHAELGSASAPLFKVVSLTNYFTSLTYKTNHGDLFFKSGITSTSTLTYLHSV